MAKKVNFILYQKAGQESGIILLRFNYKAKRFQITTGISIAEKYWNKNSQRVKETRAFPFYAQINKRLNDLEAGTQVLYYEFLSKGIVPTVEQFKAEWLAVLGNQEPKQDTNTGLLPFIEQFIQERKVMNRLKGSLAIYGSCLKHLKAYSEAIRKPITFDSLTKSFGSDFTGYLFNQGFADSYCHKILSTLKTIIREAESRELTKDSPFLKAKLEVKKREADSVYLNESEINTLFEMKLEGRLANVRDLFLLGCFTGLRFSDFSQLKPENFQQIEHNGKNVECLVITSKKTKQKTILPVVNPILKAILERNGNKAPKAISSQKLNDYLKELCQMAGFTQEIEINRFKAGEHHKQKVRKWEIISSHTARRSFATNAYKSGMAIPDIMKFTGHTTTASFMKYIRVGTEETAVYLSEHGFFTGKGKGEPDLSKK